VLDDPGCGGQEDCTHQVQDQLTRDNGSVELHHWTNAQGLVGILREGLIRTTWPNQTSDAIPNRVVWLTTRRDSDQGWSLNKDLCAYIPVNVPDREVVPWSA
jgi:hypothetical protein